MVYACVLSHQSVAQSVTHSVMFDLRQVLLDKHRNKKLSPVVYVSVSIAVYTLHVHRARLVLRWVAVCRRVYYLFLRTHGGMAKLSWPGWLIIYWDALNASRTRKPSLTHSSTNRARRRVTSSIETNTLTLRQTTEGWAGWVTHSRLGSVRSVNSTGNSGRGRRYMSKFRVGISVRMANFIHKDRTPP